MDSKKLCFSRGFIEKFSETILILIPFLVKTFFVFLGGAWISTFMPYMQNTTFLCYCNCIIESNQVLHIDRDQVLFAFVQMQQVQDRGLKIDRWLYLRNGLTDFLTVRHDNQDGCEWVSVSSGTVPPGSPRPKAVKRFVCVWHDNAKYVL